MKCSALKKHAEVNVFIVEYGLFEFKILMQKIHSDFDNYSKMIDVESFSQKQT